MSRRPATGWRPGRRCRTSRGYRDGAVPRPWPERLALVERILTSPRWAEAGYEWRSSDGHGRVTGPDGALLVELRHDPASDGQVIDRYQQGRMVQRNRFDERGRELR